MATIYTFDNQGKIFSLVIPTFQHSKAYREKFELIKFMPGIFQSKEEAENYLAELKEVNKSYGLTK